MLDFLRRLAFKQATISVVMTLAALTSQAQAAWPEEQPIKLIVPFAVGSTTDAVARIVAPPLSQLLGQNIVIENMPGEAGHTGVEAAIAQKANGYSLLYTSNGPLVIRPNAQTNKKRNYPWRDLSPISLVAFTPQALIINRSWGVDQLEGLIKKVQANPGKFHIGSDGAGSPSAAAASLFMQATNTDLMQVPYSGTQQIMTALRDDEVQMALLEPGAMIEPLAPNQFMVLAMTSTIQTGLNKAPTLEAIPSFTALGYATLDMQVWHAILTPAGTPTRIVNQINQAIQAVLADPVVRQKMEALYFTPQGSTAFMLSKRIELESAQWRRKLKALP